MSKQNLERTNWLGVCLLVIGFAYLYRHYHWDLHFFRDFLPGHFFSWQAIVIVIGFFLLVFGRRGGLFLMLFGAFFLFPHEFSRIFWNFHQWWPLALIVAGIIILTRSGRDRKRIEN